MVSIIAHSQQYKVYSVTGNVSAEGKAIVAKQVLSAKSFLSIAKGGKVILFDSVHDSLITLKTEGRGTVATLIKASGNTEKKISGSYLSFITQKITSDEKRGSTYMQSAGSAYRDTDSLLLNVLVPNDSVNN